MSLDEVEQKASEQARLKGLSSSSYSSGDYFTATKLLEKLKTLQDEDKHGWLLTSLRIIDCDVMIQAEFKEDHKECIFDCMKKVKISGSKAMMMAGQLNEDHDAVVAMMMYLCASELQVAVENIVQCISSSCRLIQKNADNHDQSFFLNIATPILCYMLVPLQQTDFYDVGMTAKGVASTLNITGIKLSETKRYQTSLQLRTMAFKIMAKRFGEDASKYGIFASILHNIGIDYWGLSNLVESAKHYKQSIIARLKAEDIDDEKRLKAVEEDLRYVFKNLMFKPHERELMREDISKILKKRGLNTEILDVANDLEATKLPKEDKVLKSGPDKIDPGIKNELVKQVDHGPVGQMEQRAQERANLKELSASSYSSGDYFTATKLLKKLKDLQDEDEHGRLLTSLRIIGCDVMIEAEFKKSHGKRILDCLEEVKISGLKAMMMAGQLTEDHDTVVAMMMYSCASKLHQKSPENVVENVVQCISSSCKLIKNVMSKHDQSFFVNVANPILRTMVDALQDTDFYDTGMAAKRVSSMLNSAGFNLTKMERYRASSQLRTMGFQIMTKRFGDDASKYDVYASLLHNIGVDNWGLGNNIESARCYKQSIEARLRAEDIDDEQRTKNVEQDTKYLVEKLGVFEPGERQQILEELSKLLKEHGIRTQISDMLNGPKAQNAAAEAKEKKGKTPPVQVPGANIGTAYIADNIRSQQMHFHVDPRPAAKGGQDPIMAASDTKKDGIQLTPNLRVLNTKITPFSNSTYVGVQTSKITGERKVAIKRVSIEKLSKDEADILMKLEKHPNIVSIIEIDLFPYNLPFMYIAMELCHSKNLYEVVVENATNGVPFDADKTHEYSVQLAKGMDFIHRNGIIHRDLKPHNVLLSDDLDNIKITDFGLSRTMSSGHSVTSVSARLGTDGYRAPETYTQDIISPYADVYSIGIVLYFMWTCGLHPFGDDPDLWNHHMKKNIKRNLDHLLVSNVEAAQDLLACCLQFNPRKRPTAREILLHEYFALSKTGGTSSLNHIGEPGLVSRNEHAVRKTTSSPETAENPQPYDSDEDISEEARRFSGVNPAMGISSALQQHSPGFNWGSLYRRRFLHASFKDKY